jgi:hypothetical protein
VVRVTEPSHPPRRAPKFRAFLLTGAVIGFVIGLLLSLSGAPVPNYGAVQVVGFLGLGCAAVGALLGGIIAVLLDRRS